MGDETRDAIWRAIRESNEAWTGGAPERVAALFAEDAVAVVLGAALRVRGRAAIVRSYVDYARAATTHAFTQRDPVIDVFGDTAVATYRFDIRYELEGLVREESGQEVLVFARRADGWRAIWRTQAPLERAAT